MGSVPDCQSQELLQLSRHYTLHRSRSSRVRTHQRSRVIAANCWAIIHQSEAALARVPSQWEGGEDAGARMRGGRESPEQTGGGAPGRGPRGRSAEDKRPGAAQSWPGVQGVQTQSRASCSVLFSAFFRVLEGTSPPQCCAMEVFSGEALSYLHHHQARASEGHLPPHQLGRDTLDCVVLTTLYSSLTLSPHCRGCVARPRLQPWLL